MSGNTKIPCQYCNSACIKCGKHKNGSQKLQCKACGKYQLQAYVNRGSMKRTKDNITKIYLKNVGVKVGLSFFNYDNGKFAKPTAESFVYGEVSFISVGTPALSMGAAVTQEKTS